MACEVKTYGKIQDFKKVQEYFGLIHDENWMNSLYFAISPTSELIAVGQGEKLAFLSSCWDNKTQGTTFVLSWCGELENPNHIITSLICLPIYGKNVSTGPEWTCIAVGLSSGMVMFYTDSGHKIYSQSFHDDPVLSIKAYSPPIHLETDSYVYIVYNECMCNIDGSELFPLLINCHNNVNCTLGHKVKESTPDPLEMADVIKFEKLRFSREPETIINDAVKIARQEPCTLDNIIQQAVLYGYYARVSEIPPQASSVLSAGAEPFLGFYNAEEGYIASSLGEVAKDVIGMAYKNIMGNLFNRAPEPPQAPPQTSSSARYHIRTRCRFYDGKRDGFTIAVSPNGRLAVVTDNLDRVMLVDTQRTLILRVWKGYRDAQCAFVPVKEKTLKHSPTPRRKTYFLVIYARRLGCLEIWALQNGPRVAAFTVSKSGQLSYNTHALMGVKPGSKVKASVNICLFIDPSDCSVKEIQIPFHFALSESNSKTSRDVHLLRRLKSLLRNGGNTEDIENISQLAAEFQTYEVRQQCIEMLLRNKQLKPHIFQAIVYAILKSLEQEEECTNREYIDLKTIIGHYICLVDFYIAMKSPVATEFDEDVELSDSDKSIINQLVLLLKSGGRTQVHSSEYGVLPSTSAKVTFEVECSEDGDFMDYLRIFDVSKSENIPLLESESKMFGDVSGRLFGEFFKHGLCFEKFKMDAEKSNIPHEDLLVLALHFWLEKPFTYDTCDEVYSDMSGLGGIVRAICELAGDNVNICDYNEISPWWQKVRELLLESQKSLGLLVAIVCRTVAAQLRKQSFCDDSSQTDDEGNWERISQDEAQWVLLIGKLEDVAILGAILEFPMESIEPVMPEFPYDCPDCSLKFILGCGKGIVTDLTAQWLINSRVHPSKILETKQESTASTTEVVESKDNASTKADASVGNEEMKHTDEIPALPSPDENCTDPVIEKLKLLREHFPFTLESGVVLTLMTWHYMVYWSKNLQKLEYIRAALTCLEQFKKEDYALKHGLCCMLWNATLKYPLQSTMKLIQKVGRLPVQKMCQQDLEMSAGHVPDFLELALEFLQHFTSSLDHDKRDLKFEESLADGQLPIQFIALQQHHAIKDLLKLHYELCSVLHFITFSQLKIPKPITTLFDALSNRAFFADINKELQFVLPAPDIALQQVRENFLCKVISASMDLIREDLVQLYVLEHTQYVDKVYALADSWKMEKTALKRRQIVEMYAYGYDAEAENLLKNIVLDEEIGRMLLEIAGRRLNLYANKSQSAYLKIASIGPQLLKYLDNLRDSPTSSIQITASDPDEINLVALSNLVTKTYECLSERESIYLHIVAQMYDACCVLND